MKKLFSLCLLPFLAGVLFLPARPADAAVANRAVKGSGPAIYWIDGSGQRFAFPNAATYYTWFPSFDHIVTLSDREVESYPYVGMVTYRPGAKLVKFPDDPKVYAVARWGVLRHVANESVAKGLYGAAWGTWVHDIPRTLASSYRYGEPIRSVWEYHVATEYHASGVPHTGTVPVASAAESGFTAQLSVNRGLVNAYDGVSLIARVHRDGIGGIGGDARFTVRIKDGYGRMLRTCAGLRENETCEASTSSDYDFGQTGIYLADATDVEGADVLMGSATVYPITNQEARQVTGMAMGVSQRSVSSGASVRVWADVSDVGDPSFLGKRIRIIDTRNGNVVITCHNQSWCAKDVVLKRAAGEAGVQFEAILSDEYGHELKQTFSPSVLFEN